LLIISLLHLGKIKVMADFSKQWCESYDPEMPWDFDIIEEANKLKPNYGIKIICEGYGFSEIIKDNNNNIKLGFYHGEEMNYKSLEQVIGHNGSI
jgi:hypothetical protein